MRRGAAQRTRLLLLGAVGAIAVAAGLVVEATDALRPSELDTVDLRQSIRGTKSPPKDVVVVGIDDATFQDLKTRWPFPRSFHARAIDRLKADGARVIVYDVQFTEQTTEKEDLALYDAVARAGNVVLGTSEVNRNGGTNVLGGDANLRDAHAVAGNGNFVPESGSAIKAGSIVRRVRYEVDRLRTIAVLAARRAGARVRGREFGSRGAWIDFAGPPGTVHTVSFGRLLRGQVPPSAVRGKVVVIGPTAPTLQDVHPTTASTNEPMSGAEVHANAIATILDGLPLRDAAGGVSVLLIALLGLATPAAAVAVRGLRWLWVPAAALVALLAAAQLLYDGGTIVPVASPLLALALSVLGTLVVVYFTEIRERRRLRESFGRFVSEPVVDLVVDQAEAERGLPGTRMESTVLFADLRGFTAVAERLDADRVIEVLNRYLEGMSDAILDHGGTVVAYMGDGIMAVFGAPIAQPDHADRALAAAREMAGPRLAAFNAWLREAGVAAQFELGVGINSGAVMSGTVGSGRRMEYTAVGDTTNAAARLEAMTKDTPHSVFVSEATRALLRTPADDLVDAGELPVRGRRTTVHVWALSADGAGAGVSPGSAGASVSDPA